MTVECGGVMGTLGGSGVCGVVVLRHRCREASGGRRDEEACGGRPAMAWCREACGRMLATPRCREPWWTRLAATMREVGEAGRED